MNKPHLISFKKVKMMMKKSNKNENGIIVGARRNLKNRIKI